jgi:hypothetical protein
MYGQIQKNRLTFLLIVLSAWTAFGVFFGTQNYIRDVYVGKSASLPGYIIGWLVCGYSWAILTFPVLRFLRRFSLERLGWSKLMLWHLPAGIIFSLMQLGIYVLIASTLFRGPGSGVWDFYKATVVKEFQSSFLVYFAIVFAAIAYGRLIAGAADDPVSGPRAEPVTVPVPVEPIVEAAGIQHNGDHPAFLRRIPIKENGRISLVDIDSIDWIESYGNYVLIHTPDRRHIYRETMAAMEKRLDPTDFVRIRRSAIVRIDRIKELRPILNGELDVVLKNDKVLTSTRRYRKNLQRIVG